MTEAAPLAGWIPYRFRGPSSVSWCHLGGHAFTDPFFEQTIARCMATPFNQLFAHKTTVDELVEWSVTSPGLQPSALIFHTSRCGSTLFSQIATALPRTIAISEAPPVDQMLRAEATEEVRVGWLRALVSAYGQRRTGSEQHLLVKFDAWHIIDLPLIQRAFPGVPSVFLYRRPDEVLASQLRMPGVYMIPGVLPQSLTGIDPQTALQFGREEHFGRVLALVYEAGLRHSRSGRVDLMNYNELPGGAVRRLLDWFGIDETAEIRERIEQVTSADAKTPSLPFDRAEVAARRVPAGVEATAQRLLDPLYENLESLRTGNPVYPHATS